MAVMTSRAVDLPAGEPIPALGQGTWHIGRGAPSASRRAPSFADGHRPRDDADRHRGDVRRGRHRAARRRGHRRPAREVFLVSKVLPSHATRRGTIAACRASLRRLATDQLDLYLLHWRGMVPLDETVAAFEELRAAGLIRHWGVSNFDLSGLRRLVRSQGGGAVQADQVLYNLTRRGIEWDLLPWSLEHGLPIMAYSPLEQGRIVEHPVLQGIARHYHATPAQVALAWVLSHAGVCAIPEAGTVKHVRQNRAALDLRLREIDMVKLDEAFPPPIAPQPLEIL